MVTAPEALAAYDRLTERRTRFMRVDELCARAAKELPGFLPSPEQLQAEASLALRDKKGLEGAQGRFLAHVLGDAAAGTHLCHAMLLPLPESADLAARFAADGALDLGPARLERHGQAVHLTAANPRFLNAEDETTLAQMELAVDVAILEPRDVELRARSHGDEAAGSSHRGDPLLHRGRREIDHADVVAHPVRRVERQFVGGELEDFRPGAFGRKDPQHPLRQRSSA